MSIADDLRSARVLTIDIETRPSTAYIWDAKTDWVNPGMLIENGSVICFAAKWLGHKKVHYYSDYHHGHTEMVQAAWDMLDEADLLVTYNGKRFDCKHLRREFILEGMPPPAPWKDVDLIQTVRAKFAWHSNSLNHVSGRLGVGEKVKHAGFDLWKGCLAGDEKSWATMKRYNMQDVRLTEDLYVQLLPWISNHPAVRVADTGELLCNRCGSADLDRIGSSVAQVMAYAMYRCQSCTGLCRAAHVKRVSNVRGLG